MTSRQDPLKIIAALSLGFAAGLLFAPRSGQETRDRLRDQAEEAKTRMKNATGELKRHGQEGQEQLRQAAASVKDTSKTLKNNMKQQAKEAKDDVKRASKKPESTPTDTSEQL